MDPDVLIVRENNGYRVLHGHLHLANLLRMADQAEVLAVSEGSRKVLRTADGILVDDGRQALPLLRH